MASGGTLEWVFEIFDKISGPARRMATAMDHMSRATGRGGKSAHDASKHFESLRHRLFEYGEIIRNVGEVAMRLGEKAFDFAREAKNAISFKQTTMIALEAVLHSREKAAEVFEMAERFSKLTGLPAQELANIGKGLAEAKFDPKDINVFMQAIGDINTLKGPAAMEQYAQVLEDIATKGSATGRELNALKGTGIDLEAVYKNVASMYSLNADNLKDLKAGLSQPLPAAGVLKAILETQSGQFGGVGFLAARQGQTLEGQVSRLGGGLERAFQSLVGGPGLAAFQGALENLIKIVQPGGPLGKAMRELANGPLADFFKQFTGKEGLAKMQEIFKGLADSIKSLVEAVKEAYDLTFGQKIGDTVYKTLNPATNIENAAGGRNAMETMARNTLADPNASEMSRTKARQVLSSSNVTVHVDARGATKEDAHAIGQAVHKAVAPHMRIGFQDQAIEAGTQ